MAKSKLVNANKKIEETVVGSYKKVEQTAVDTFSKISDKFVDAFLTKEGESVTDAKARLVQEQENRLK